MSYITRMVPLHPRIRPRLGSSAFSLIELLAVVAVIGMVAVLSVGGFSSSDASKFNSQCWTVTESFQNAREFAKAKRTYVWVGLNPGGQEADKIVLSAHYSTTGLNSLIASNLVPAMRPRVLSGMGMSAQLSHTQDATDLLQDSDLGSLDFTQGGENYSVSSLVEFAPDGSARVLTASGRSTIGVPLIAKKGGRSLPNHTVDILISRLTGNIELVRE